MINIKENSIKAFRNVFAVLVFALVFTFGFGVNAHAAYVTQTAIGDNSATINFEGLASYSGMRVSIVEIPIDADYSKISTLETNCKNNAINNGIVVGEGNYSYTFTGLKPQSKYYAVVAYDYVTSYSTSTYTTSLPVYTKIKSINNLAQKKWWKYIESVDVTWDAVPADYSTNVKYEIVFMNAKGKTIEKKTSNYVSYSHSIKNNKIYRIKVRATRTFDSVYNQGLDTETTSWNEQYLFTQPTVSYAKLAKGKLKIKWNKISGVTSYDVYVSTKKSSGYKKVKTLKAKKNSCVIKKFKKKKLKKKKYYVYVVPNKKVNGKVIKKDVTYVYAVKKGTTSTTEEYK